MSSNTEYTTKYADISLNEFVISTLNISDYTILSYSIACSGNGKYVILPNNYGGFYVSTNYGKTIIAISVGNINVYSKVAAVTMSRDGKYIYLGGRHSAARLRQSNNAERHTFVSSDYGNTFKNYAYTATNFDVDIGGAVTSIACSKSGKYAVLLEGGGTNRNKNLYISDNYGDTWVLKSDQITVKKNVTISNSGKYVSFNTDSSLYLSENYGSDWSPNTHFSTFQLENDCSGVITSSYIAGNGKIIYVTVSADISGATILRKGGICISKDFGNNWAKTDASSNLRWDAIKCSENGQYAMAVAVGNINPLTEACSIYMSTNYGDNWTNTNQNVLQGVINQGVNSNGAVAMTSSGQCSYFYYRKKNTSTLNDVATYITNNYTYSYTPIKIAYNNTFNFTYTCTLYDCSGKYFLRNEKNETLSTKVITDTTVNSITFTDISTNSFDYGMSNLFVYKENDNPNDDPGNDIQISDPMVINATCFLEGTKILAMDKKRILKYIPIEKLKPGMLVKTLHAGFVPIKYIGYSTIYNPGLATRVRDQLFKCTKSKYPELIEDLVLTGNHSVLVDTITDQEREQITETLGGIYVTERKYRLPVFNDKRAVTYEHRGDFRIWNLALENEDYYSNYGIYANGLLVETTSCRYIKEISRMTLINE